MRLGAQMSAAGGLYKAFERGEEAGCDSILVFTKSNRQWNAKPITEEDIQLYREAAEKYAHIQPVSVHASYLINIASPDAALWEKSYLALKDEVEEDRHVRVPGDEEQEGGDEAHDGGPDRGDEGEEEGRHNWKQNGDAIRERHCDDTVFANEQIVNGRGRQNRIDQAGRRRERA